MKNDITEVVFILDKSGSMSGFEADTVGGFNSVIKEQKDGVGRVFVSTVLFSNDSRVLHDRLDVKEIKPMETNDFRVGGGTALFDAVGDAIRHIGNIHKYARQEDIPGRTIFFIMTDGMENASRRYSRKDVKAMIERQRKKYGWEFIFLASNIDVEETAESLGIFYDEPYEQTESGFEDCFDDICSILTKTRRRESIDKNDLTRKKKDKKEDRK